MEKLDRLTVSEGVRIFPGLIDAPAQKVLIGEVAALFVQSPLYRPVMPGSGTPFRVEQTCFGPLGWVSDRSGYRYQPYHPVTGQEWATIPPALLTLWNELTGYPAPPECCLVNFYRGDQAKMGLHQDRDEPALDAPVLSLSLGDSALFRLGGSTRKGPTRSFRLNSGDGLIFGGPARLSFHGIDRLYPDTSRLIDGGGRINLTLRRVTRP
ncbi:MAG: alpha-ketoglutarate-dependent dioxygenase AlkB [Parvibaculaceae bacterium]|nr:alpha-ketoglutarate-dependent dioxygenase AlkB [Parvibaculaceae bacterium]